MPGLPTDWSVAVVVDVGYDSAEGRRSDPPPGLEVVFSGSNLLRHFHQPGQVPRTRAERSVLRHQGTDTLILPLLYWQAPLGVLSTKRRCQSPEWTILRMWEDSLWGGVRSQCG